MFYNTFFLFFTHIFWGISQKKTNFANIKPKLKCLTSIFTINN